MICLNSKNEKLVRLRSLLQISSRKAAMRLALRALPAASPRHPSQLALNAERAMLLKCRQSDAKQTCHRHRESDVHDPSETCAALDFCSAHWASRPVSLLAI